MATRKLGIFLPVGLIALLGIALLAVGLFGSSPARAAYSESGSVAAQSRSSATLKRSSTGLLHEANRLVAANSIKAVSSKGLARLAADQTNPGSGLNPGNFGLNSSARVAAEGELDDLQPAIDNTRDASSYDFEIQVTDPMSGPVEGAGQYVAPDMVNVNVTDQAGNQREGTIFGENVYVREGESDWQLQNGDEVDDPTAAAQLISSFASTPNVFDSISIFLDAADNVEDEGVVQLQGADAEHYTFDLNGSLLVGDEDADPYIFGTGELYVDPSTDHILALNYDIDYDAFLTLIFGQFDPESTVTPSPVAEEDVVHLIYSLSMSNFDAPRGFEEPDVQMTATPVVKATNTRRPTNTRVPTRTSTAAPTVAATETPAGSDTDQMIGDAIDAMFNSVDTYHVVVEDGDNFVDTDGSYQNSHLDLTADVKNPNRVSLSYEYSLSDNGDDSVERASYIRIGDSVYVKNEQTNDLWEKQSIDDVGEDAVATVYDIRDYIVDAQLIDDEEFDGVMAHHIVFQLDLQTIFGEDVDLSLYDTESSGEYWISVDDGYILDTKYYYRLEDPDSGLTVEESSHSAYSAFGEPVTIRIPTNPED